MKKMLFVMVCSMLMTAGSVFATSVDDAAANLAADLQKQYSQKTILKIAIADIVTRVIPSRHSATILPSRLAMLSKRRDVSFRYSISNWYQQFFSRRKSS